MHPLGPEGSSKVTSIRYLIPLVWLCAGSACSLLFGGSSDEQVGSDAAGPSIDGCAPPPDDAVGASDRGLLDPNLSNGNCPETQAAGVIFTSRSLVHSDTPIASRFNQGILKAIIAASRGKPANTAQHDHRATTRPAAFER